MSSNVGAVREIAVGDARDLLDALVAEVARTGSKIVLTQDGRPVARLVPPDAGATHRFFESAERLRSAFRDLSGAELDERIDRALADVRGRRVAG